jgi:hypothetical protein
MMLGVYFSGVGSIGIRVTDCTLKLEKVCVWELMREAYLGTVWTAHPLPVLQSLQFGTPAYSQLRQSRLVCLRIDSLSTVIIYNESLYV